MNLLELFRLIREFSLHFLRANEEILQETPALLHFNKQLNDIVDGAQVQFPCFDGLLEVSHVFGEQHIIDHQLMLFETFEVLFDQLQGMDVGFFVLNELEFNFSPLISYSLDLLAHLQFLLGGVSDVLDFVLELIELQVPNGLDG